MNEIVQLDACALSTAIARREVSCREVMLAYLEQIDRHNPTVNAIVALQDRDDLLAQADERDAQLARGERMGWMHGFPQAPKDLTEVAGIVSTQGSLLLADHVPDIDSYVVERARRSGAIMIGKTNVPEFGLGGNTYNSVYGTTRNAFDPSKSSSGSSGGAAVSVALRMLPVADGSDTMGSQRNPAAWNNGFALRPSYGRVAFGPFPDVFFHHLPTEGPQGRTVADVAMLLSVQAGHDQRAPLSIEQDPSMFAGSLERDLTGARVGWLGDYDGYLPTEPGVMAHSENALRHFETIGMTVEPVSIGFPMEDLWQTWLTMRGLVAVGTAQLLGIDSDPARKQAIKPEARWEMDSGAALTSLDIHRAMTTRTAWYLRLAELFETYDALVLPTTQVFPIDADLHWPTHVGGVEMSSYHRWLESSIGASLAGIPALNVPSGLTSAGLPMGLQILGPAHADMQLLQIGRAYEEASGCTRVLSPLLAG